MKKEIYPDTLRESLPICKKVHLKIDFLGTILIKFSPLKCIKKVVKTTPIYQIYADTIKVDARIIWIPMWFFFFVTKDDCHAGTFITQLIFKPLDHWAIKLDAPIFQFYPM